MAAVALGAGGARGRAEVNARSKVDRSFSRLVVVLVCVPGCKRGSPSADSRLVAGLSLMSWMGGGARSRRLCCWPSGCFAAASVPWYFFFSVPVVSLRSSCNCSCFARFRLARSFPEEGSLIWVFQNPGLSLFSLCLVLFIHTLIHTPSQLSRDDGARAHRARAHVS